MSDNLAEKVRERVLLAVGALSGLAWAVLPHIFDAPLTGFGHGWALDAFGAFGAMSGFALASFAIILGLRGSETDVALKKPAGRWLLKMLMRSMWAWLIVALASLLGLVSESPFASLPFRLTCGPAVAQGVLALWAFKRFFNRYTATPPV